MMQKKRLLITGFDPFGGESVNPAREAVFSLPDTIGNWQLYKKQVPTVFSKAAQEAIAAAEALSPEVILCIGQAGGRSAVTAEYVAVNFRNASLADNAGNLPRQESILPRGENAYFSTLPVHDICAKMKQAGENIAVSYSAGVYVCNDLYYTLLHRFRNTATRVCFIHVPFLP